MHGTHCAYRRSCQEDPVSSPFRGLEETTRTTPHHMAEHHTAGLLRSHNLTLPEAMDVVQNWSLRRMRSTRESYILVYRSPWVDVRNLELHARNDDDAWNLANCSGWRTGDITRPVTHSRVLVRRPTNDSIAAVLRLIADT